MPAYNTQVDRELLLAFFLTFSRFEYALKASGFFRRPRTTRNRPGWPYEAEPDWDRFAVLVHTTFQPDRAESLEHACEYMLHSPPLKQVIILDAVGWETPLRPTRESDAEFLLRMVRCVRNNLFHGGKYNVEVHESTERTAMLLKSSIVILEEFLELAPDVKRQFDEAIV